MKFARAEICDCSNELAFVLASITFFSYLWSAKPENDLANPMLEVYAHSADVNADRRSDLIITDRQGYVHTFIRGEDGMLSDSHCSKTLDEFLARQR